MTPESVMTVFNETLYIIVILTMVVLVPALVVGLVVAMFQAATQINEMTLSFIPKLLVVLGVLMAAGPWMLEILIDFTKRHIGNIPMLIG